jgi:hypothetical protein
MIACGYITVDPSILVAITKEATKVLPWVHVSVPLIMTKLV